MKNTSWQELDNRKYERVRDHEAPGSTPLYSVCRHSTCFYSEIKTFRGAYDIAKNLIEFIIPRLRVQYMLKAFVFVAVQECS